MRLSLPRRLALTFGVPVLFRWRIKMLLKIRRTRRQTAEVSPTAVAIPVIFVAHANVYRSSQRTDASSIQTAVGVRFASISSVAPSRALPTALRRSLPSLTDGTVNRAIRMHSGTFRTRRFTSRHLGTVTRPGALTRRLGTLRSSSDYITMTQ